MCTTHSISERLSTPVYLSRDGSVVKSLSYQEISCQGIHEPSQKSVQQTFLIF